MDRDIASKALDAWIHGGLCISFVGWTWTGLTVQAFWKGY